MSFGIPSISPALTEVTNALAQTVDTARSAAANTVSAVGDFGSAALGQAGQLAAHGVELGQQAVNAVRDIDVREAASTVRSAVDTASGTARADIGSAVASPSQRMGASADVARASVAGGDNPVSNTIRGAFGVQESAGRLSPGAVGGAAREAVGLSGAARDLATTAATMQLAPAAARNYGTALLGGAKGAMQAAGSSMSGGGPAGGVPAAAVGSAGVTLARGSGEALLRDGEALVRTGVDTDLVAANPTIGVVVGAERSVTRLEAGSTHDVNPAFSAPERAQDCVAYVIATERRFAGGLSGVAPRTGGPLPIRTITDTFGGTFRKVSGAAEIGSILSGSGDGARGIVYGADTPRGFGHVWNVRIDDGVVRFLDSQPGAKAGLGVGNFDHFTDLHFLLTHAGT